MRQIEALIRMATLEPVILTTKEYEQLEKEVQSHILCGDTGISYYILAKLLLEHAPRYHEAVKLNLGLNNP